MSAIGHGRWSQFFERLFGVKGGGGGPDTVLQDVMPVLDVLSDDPTAMWARGEHLFQFKNTQAAGGAGTYAYTGISPPEGMMIVVTRMCVTASTAGTRQWGVTAIDAPVAGALASRLDGRDPAPTFRAQGAAPAAIAAELQGYVYTPASQWTEVPGAGAVIVPGTAFVVQNVTANEMISMNVTGWWRRCPPEEYQD